MDREITARRNQHALIELERRGVLTTGELPVGQRAIMAVFPGLRVPHYGSGLAWTLIMAAVFALGMAVPLLLIAQGGGGLGVGGAVIVALGAGLAFGAIMTGFLRSVHRRLRLTPWEALDEMPMGTAPEGTPTYDRLEDEMIRRANRLRSGLD